MGVARLMIKKLKVNEEDNVMKAVDVTEPAPSPELGPRVV